VLYGRPVNLPEEHDRLLPGGRDDRRDRRPEADLIGAGIAHAPEEQANDDARHKCSHDLEQTRYFGAQSYEKTGWAAVLRRRALRSSSRTAQRLIGPVSA
jgi:hypothetical protein